MRYLRKTSNDSSVSTLLSHFPHEDHSTSDKSSTPSISSDDIRRCPVVVVDWYDAVCTGGSEWQTMEEVSEALSNGPSLVRSVGMLVANEPGHIALVDTCILDGDCCGYVHVIPRGMVVAIHEVWGE